MPELPEVETIRRQLHRRLAGSKIVEVKVWRSGRETPRSIRLSAALVDRTIVSVERRAKLLIWKLDHGQSLVAHLKMTGRFVFVSSSHEPAKHDRIGFSLRRRGQNIRVVWSDVRQFGFIRLVSTSTLKKLLETYGPEPLKISPEKLAERLKSGSVRKLKSALLDQTVIAGIGNIYADEVCHRAGLLPTRRLASLSSRERVGLARVIQSVLRAAVAERGTSADDYVDAQGKPGNFLKFLRVYGRAGKPCRSCHQGIIKKIVLGQRGTHYCTRCQR